MVWVPKNALVLPAGSAVIWVWVIPRGPNSRSAANARVSWLVAVEITRSRFWMAALL